MGYRRIRRSRGFAFVLVAFVAACGGGDGGPAPTPAPTPSKVTRRLEPGTAVDLTASVIRVLGPNSFVISDADLPVAGQLVVSDTPVTVRVYALVRISGRVERFDAAAYDRYGLHDPQLYQPFGEVVVVAVQVRGFPAASPSAS